MGTISPEMRAEAAAWLARLRADDKSAADERAFRTWLAEDPCHAAAFEAITEVWELAGASWRGPVTIPREKAVTRRRALVGSLATAAAAGVGLTVWQRAYAGVYETAIGEQKHVVLADGTQVFLDTDTRIHTSYDSRMRMVSVERGRCNFHVMESDIRPFVVDAAAERIVAGRTTFDVRRDGDAVCVVMVQGSAVAEDTANAADNRYDLRAGDRLIRSNGRTRTDRPNILPLLAWQTGQVVFDNETVAGATREMNRYSVVKIDASDPGVAGLRISGVYRVGDNAAFARSMAALLPVAVEIESDQVRLYANPARAKKT